jgi:hypothetical protein
MTDLDPRVWQHVIPHLHTYLDHCDEPQRHQLLQAIYIDGKYELDWYVGSNGTNTWLDVIATGTVLFTLNGPDIGIHVIDKHLIYVEDES